VALDSAPRKFVLHVSEVDVSLNVAKGHDQVKIQFDGALLPTTRKRLVKAIRQGQVEIRTKVIM
jgi:hypothetical protein